MVKTVIFKKKRHIITGVVFGLAALFVSWLGGSEASPFYEYFLWHVTLPNIWMKLNFPVLLAYLLTGSTSPAFGILVIFFNGLSLDS